MFMRSITRITITFLCLFVFNSCSSVKVLSSWQADDLEAIKDNTILVIARTNNTSARVFFENEIVSQLAKKNIKATASFSGLSSLNPNKVISQQEQKALKAQIQKQGYNGVVVTVIKDKENFTKTVTEDGGYQGGTFFGTYPAYYGGFYGYYNDPMSYATKGVYKESTATTYTTANYILETVVYDLEKQVGEQLVAVVSTKLEEPDAASSIVRKYVAEVIKALEK